MYEVERENKRSNLYHEIRKKQIDFTFKILRKTTLQIPKLQANRIAIAHFKQLKTCPNNLRLLEILKELKEIIASFELPEIINNYSYIIIIFKLQADESLDVMSQKFVHEILVQIASFKSSLMNVRDLNLSHLCSQNSEIVDKLLMLLGNLMIRDQYYETPYYLIKQGGIFKKLVNILFSPQHFYKYVEVNLIWVSTILFDRAKRFMLTNIDTGYYENLLLQIFQRTKAKLLKRNIQYQQDQNLKNPNQLFLTLKVIIQSQKIKEDPELFAKLEELFELQNIHYMNLMTTILWEYNYILPEPLLQQIVCNILPETNENLIEKYLKIIFNSLCNNMEVWKIVQRNFVHGVEKLDNDNFKELYPMTAVFVWLFQNQNFRDRIFEIICYLIMCKGELGIFQECTDVFLDSDEPHIYEKLRQLSLIQ